MKLVSIVILNWNGKDYLRQCITSGLEQTHHPIELFVIDNASSDGSVEWLQQNFPSLSVIRNKKNLGFAAAINQGIRLSRGDYVMPLNFDVIMTKTFVEELVKVAERDTRTGSVSGKLLRFASPEENRSYIDSAGHIIYRNRLVVNRGESEIDFGQYDQEEEVFGACGAAPLYCREMLEDIKIGGEYYDENFFAFWEDIDLDWRARLRNWESLYTPRAVAYHQRGGPSLRRSSAVELHNYKNRYLVILKNDKLYSFLKASPQILFTEILKAGAILTRCPSALVKGWILLIRLLPQTLKKRKEIQGRRLVSQTEIEKWFYKFDYPKWIRRHLLNRGLG